MGLDRGGGGQSQMFRVEREDTHSTTGPNDISASLSLCPYHDHVDMFSARRYSQEFIWFHTFHVACKCRVKDSCSILTSRGALNYQQCKGSRRSDIVVRSESYTCASDGRGLNHLQGIYDA